MATFSGTVYRTRIARGSKSERTAVKLRTEDGEFLLRRANAASLKDDQLDALVGQRVRFDGVKHGATLIVSSWSIEA